MGDANGPSIIRYNTGTYLAKPGLHSYNVNRRSHNPPVKLRALRKLQLALFILGLCGIGYYGYTLSDQYIYQGYENWAFDQQIAGRPPVTFADYVREQTPFAFLAGAKAATPAVPSGKPVTPEMPPEPSRPSEGSFLGRVEIGRLNLSAMVREGVDPKILSMTVGHVPTTALPGETGNFAIAAHRDTLFRALKDIKKNDLIRFQAPSGTYTYEVVSTRIVRPSNVSVLQPDGGGLILPAAASGNQADNSKLLTMITCYPFYYVGAAPKRFIVQARLRSADSASKPPSTQSQSIAPRKPQRPLMASNQTRKKRSVWHKVFHVS